MNTNSQVRVGFVALALFAYLSSAARDKPPAQNKPAAQNKTAIPTLREEAAKKGYAYKAPFVDYYGCCENLDDLLPQNELIVRGCSIDENARLSDDEIGDTPCAAPSATKLKDAFAGSLTPHDF